MSQIAKLDCCSDAVKQLGTGILAGRVRIQSIRSLMEFVMSRCVNVDINKQDIKTSKCINWYNIRKATCSCLGICMWFLDAGKSKTPRLNVFLPS